MMKMPFETGVAHSDDPPPEVLEDLEALRVADRFRFANELRAWVEIEDGRIVGAGYAGDGRSGGRIGATTMNLGAGKVTVQAVPLPDRQQEPEVNEASARFVQTAGGRTGVPAPRRVKHPPFI